jgi:hypothetical protein
MPKATILNGSYRRGGATDQLLGTAADALARGGLDVATHKLIDLNLSFCRNCRACTQMEGPRRGVCPIEDDAAGVFDDIEGSDWLVVGSPLNFGTVTAVTKTLLERMVCYAHWPWGQAGPRYRIPKPVRRAILVTSSAMPGPMSRLFTSGMRELRALAKTVGARPVLTYQVGMVALGERWEMPARLRQRIERKVRRFGGGAGS